MRDGPVVNIAVREGDGGDGRVDLGDRLISFEFEDNARKADKCVITLDNFDLRFLDDPTWRRGQQLEVSWGYPGNMATPQRVIVKRVSGGIVLRVEGIARSVLLNQKKKRRAFNNVTRADVVREVAREYGFSGSTLFIEDTDEQFETINQRNETDAAFLKRLAKKEDFIFYVDAEGLHWESEPFDGKPTHVLTYYTDQGRGDIISFNLDTDLFKSPGKVTVKGRDHKTKKPFEVTADDNETKRTDLGDELEVVDERTGATSIQKRMAHETTVHSSAKDEKEAKREANARFRKASRKRMKLKLQVVGDPTLTAKRVIEVGGLGDYVSGKYFVTMTKHKIQGGYTQDLALKKGSPAKVPGGAPKSAADKNRAKASKDQTEMFEKIDERTGASTFHRRPVKG